MHVNPYGRLVGVTFVLRLWKERGNGDWHGQIVHLASQESTYFGSLAQAEVFISRFAEGIEEQASSRKGEDENVED